MVVLLHKLNIFALLEVAAEVLVATIVLTNQVVEEVVQEDFL
tara:strand:- start:1700 stop:1825 length:126 start_codon:yes stop_codon:yes gene_type:complete